MHIVDPPHQTRIRISQETHIAFQEKKKPTTTKTVKRYGYPFNKSLRSEKCFQNVFISIRKLALGSFLLSFFFLCCYPRHSWSNEFQNLCVSMAFWDLYQTWLSPPQTVDSNSKDLVKRYAFS